MSTFRKTAETFRPAMTLPAFYYTSSEIFELEKRHVFQNYPVCVGHVNRIPNIGEYFLAMENSLIIVRDKLGMIHAFHNTCRHRGTRVCETVEGTFKGSIQCSYHAWTYGLDGALIGAPFTKDLPGFRKEDYPLLELPVTLWEGFIFVGGKIPPELNALGKTLSNWHMAGLREYTRIQYDVKSNWKYIFQNFSECYHCPTLHPRLNELTDYTGGENNFTQGPVLGGFMEITGGDSMTMSGRMCALSLGSPKEEGKRAYYYSIMPNLLLNIHPDYLMFHLLFPVNQSRTIVVSDWLFNPRSFGRQDFNPRDAVEFWDLTNKQDWHVCELGQLGVNSNGYRSGPYTPRESLLAEFDRAYLDLMWIGS